MTVDPAFGGDFILPGVTFTGGSGQDRGTPEEARDHPDFRDEVFGSSAVASSSGREIRVKRLASFLKSLRRLSKILSVALITPGCGLPRLNLLPLAEAAFLTFLGRVAVCELAAFEVS